MFDSLIDILIKRGSSQATFSIKLPDGTVKKSRDGKDEFQVVIKSDEVYKAVISKGSLGIGEQFMLGNLDVTGDFDKAVITLVSIVKNDNDSFITESLLVKLFDNFKRFIFPETKNKALKDISAHYDISNDFYKKFLDPTMTYSCGYFKKDTDSLENAQQQKYEYISRKLLLKPGERLVDIGCGWGGMLIYAAQHYGVSGYGVTLSKNQFELANEKIKKLKLEKQIKVELKDYRDVLGKYDKFVSIGMFEHVTHKYYDQFFRKIKQLLIPGGAGLLHTIGLNKQGIVPIDPWLSTYIFPGTQIPSARWLMEYCGKYFLYPTDLENLRPHYALTLKHWINNYLKIYEQTVEEKGEKFARMWKWYLYISRASFVTNIGQLYQVTFINGINNDYPLTREYLYK